MTHLCLSSNAPRNFDPSDELLCNFEKDLRHRKAIWKSRKMLGVQYANQQQQQHT